MCRAGLFYTLWLWPIPKRAVCATVYVYSIPDGWMQFLLIRSLKKVRYPCLATRIFLKIVEYMSILQEKFVENLMKDKFFCCKNLKYKSSFFS